MLIRKHFEVLGDWFIKVTWLTQNWTHYLLQTFFSWVSYLSECYQHFLSHPSKRFGIFLSSHSPAVSELCRYHLNVCQINAFLSIPTSVALAQTLSISCPDSSLHSSFCFQGHLWWPSRLSLSLPNHLQSPGFTICYYTAKPLLALFLLLKWPFFSTWQT